MKGYIIVILLLLGGAGNVSAQKERSHIRSGNKAYAGGDYVEAEVDLLYIYDKSERESISFAEIESLLKQNGLK